MCSESHKTFDFLMQGDADEAATEARVTDDKAKKAMLDAAKLAEELRYEQDHAQLLERERKELEARAHDIQVQTDDAEQNAIKWGRKMVAKLESRYGMLRQKNQVLPIQGQGL